MKLLLIDDDPIVTRGLKTILELNTDNEVVALGKDGEDLLPLFEKHHPDVILMDIRMKNMDGIKAGKELLKIYGNAKIVYLSTFHDPIYLKDAQGMGAYGYILKQDFEKLPKLLETINEGYKAFTDMPSTNESFINDKERQIITLIAQGLSNKEIAVALFLSEGTIRNYISTILDKLSVRDRTQLVIYYYKNMV